MKTVSLSINNGLKGFINLITSQTGYATQTKGRTWRSYRTTGDDGATPASPNSTSRFNRLTAGHFLAGPHGIFDPRLVK
ncbi:hypothetical protein [Paraflavitalea speifideaquila]|uniref:hypothetical protein n=1 Tax=Paraflavitalea speifideaquila TaxID=3076558 RepID=UPI0028E639BA|nr:hypothetical protein [Paraflavitalea speifideiaquila]